MNRIWLFLAAILALAPVSAFTAGKPASQTGGQAPETISTNQDVRTETWGGKVLTATFRAGMCFGRDGHARGVLILRHANGNSDVYHLHGTWRDNDFDLTHSSGHIIQGSLTGPETMKGTVRINKGPKLTLEGRRTLDVPLAASDCAPLN